MSACIVYYDCICPCIIIRHFACRHSKLFSRCQMQHPSRCAAPCARDGAAAPSVAVLWRRVLNGLFPDAPATSLNRGGMHGSQCQGRTITSEGGQAVKPQHAPERARRRAEAVEAPPKPKSVIGAGSLHMPWCGEAASARRRCRVFPSVCDRDSVCPII